jgi:hypothetical protein
LPVAGDDERKRTNEIGMAIPVLEGCELKGKDVTADALLTQRTLARYLVARQAHYHFTVKSNQPTLQGEFAPSGLDPESMELGPKAGQRREFPV